MQIDMLMQPAARDPKPLDRVRLSTPARLNQKIDQAMMKRVWEYARRKPDDITERIQELDRE